jgi:multidrug resistance efflux pump
MIKTITFLLLSITLYGTDIPLDKVQKHTFLQKITVNSQIIRLSNAKQAVMSLVDGHIEKYFVKEGEKVSLHQKIALINSITLSRMTSEFISLQKQFRALNKNYLATKELYLKGLASLQTLNEQSSAKDALLSQLDTLTSQLQTLGIDTKKLTRPASGYILKAHSSGIVAKISEPLHAVISKESKIIEIVKERSFFLKSFVPLKYAKLIRKAQKATLHYLGEEIPLHITKILPNIDEYTQRIVILYSI